MDVYVAGSFAEKDRVRAAIKLLKRAGHTITYDWTKSDAKNRTGEKLRRFLAREAEKDCAGVGQADAVIVLHSDLGRGMLVELGMALLSAAVPMIFIVDDAPVGERCVFYYHPDVDHVGSVEEAIEFLRLSEERERGGP